MERRSKILYLITKSNFGGAQRYVYDLATHLASSYDVVVAHGGTGERDAPPGALAERLTAAGIRTINVRHFMRNMSWREDLSAFREVYEIVRREQPDVLHLSSSKAGGMGALIGRLCGVRTIIFTSHGLTFDETWRPRWQRALIWLFTTATVLLSTTTIQLSKDTFTRASNLPFARRRVVHIPNGIEPPHFTDRTTARRTLAARNADTERWIGCIAEYHPNKNLDVLIRAMGDLSTRIGDVHVWLIGVDGDGAEKQRLQECARACHIESRVHLCGFIPDAARLLPAFDLFVLPSRKEGLPYVLMEAGYAGVPVVASNIPGNTDIIIHKRTGLVTETTPTAVARAIETILNDPGYARSLADALSAHVRTVYSVDTMVADTRKLYDSTNPTTSLSASS